MQGLIKTFQPVAAEIKKLELVPNTHLLVVTGADDKVMDNGVSQNYNRVFSENFVKGKTIQEVLGISSEDADTILKDSRANKVLHERKLLGNTRLGQEQVGISGIVILNPQGEYSGIYLLVRMLANDYSLDKLLSDYQKGMVRSLLNKTGTEQKEEAEIKQLLADYYQALFYALHNRVIAEGGAIFADAFITELKSAVKQQGWQVEIQTNSLIDISKLSLSEARKALPILFETAKSFVGKLADEESANALVQNVRSKFGDLALSNVSYFESAKIDRTYR